VTVAVARSARSAVTGWLMCTDNMPSGSAYKLGDVLTARGGTTVEVRNTDAEGRLVMMDALVLANEEGVDAIVDIATLTGTALMALGPALAAVIGNDTTMIALVKDASAATDERVWELPLERKYRKQLDSDVADLANIGGPYAGATTAALFLAEFVGETPWAHLDIAGTMQSEADDAWRSKGATGFGARLLIEVAREFRPAK
ncbi:M17 family metallopeptidase, partial [Streptomyces sp. NPDC096080]|uniref:leucyl aminopeptidase family protein n=1 Tax=Streptomyces sp. NPDC096080 TaxID=3156693 RepID=UPI0033275754